MKHFQPTHSHDIDPIRWYYYEQRRKRRHTKFIWAVGAANLAAWLLIFWIVWRVIITH